MMKREALTLVLLAAACASHEAAPPDPAGSNDAPPVAPSTWLWQSDGQQPRSPTYLLGVVGQEGISHCPGGTYDRQWLAVHPTIGRVDVSGPADDVFDPVMDKAVLAIGNAGPAPQREGLSVSPELCPPMQMRSDWHETPRGMMIMRSSGAGISHLEVTAVRELHELQARVEGDHVVVTLLNPIPVALRDVELRVHYEGCFGKPGSTVETTVIGDLAVGALASTRVPLVATRTDAQPGRGTFLANSVQLIANGDAVGIDLDVGFPSLGVDIDCPERG